MARRLADKAAMRILSISRAIRRDAQPKPPQEVELEAPAPSPVTPPAPPAPGEVPELGAAGMDVGTVLQGGDMFDALTKGAA